MEGLLEPELVEKPRRPKCGVYHRRERCRGCCHHGKLHRNCRVRVHGKQVVYEGDLDFLRRNKDDVKEVATGFECGVGTDRFANWEEGDRIEAFKMVTNAANSPPEADPCRVPVASHCSGSSVWLWGPFLWNCS